MIKNITAQNFVKFGWVIEYPNKNLFPKSKNLFRIVLKENKKFGWRIAYLVVRDKAVDKLEQHPDSFESFEPINGRSVLFVSLPKTPNKVQAFNLNKPIILKKGIWHAIITLTKESEIKITENALVKCVYKKLLNNLIK